jgi:hypothetical protein
VRRWLRGALCAGVALGLLGGCATSEYTTAQARADLVHLGWSRAEAQCFLDGLQSYYSKKYVAANRQADAQAKVKFSGVNPQGTQLFVRNELTNAGSVDAGEKAEVSTLVRHCRG